MTTAPAAAPTEFRDVITAELTRRAWSQGALARALGLNSSLVSKHLAAEEHRRVVPSQRNVERYAEVLGLDRVELLNLAGYAAGVDGTLGAPEPRGVRPPVREPAEAAPEFRVVVNGWLERRGWSQSQLAQAADINPSLVSKHLTADDWRRVRPSTQNLERYAPVLDVPYEELLRLCGYLPGKPDLPLETDQIEADVRATIAELMAAVRGAPSWAWAAMTKPLLAGLVGIVREQAQNLNEGAPQDALPDAPGSHARPRRRSRATA